MINITEVLWAVPQANRYVRERHEPLDLSAISIAIAQATEHVQLAEDFDATAQGYIDLLEAILDPSESEHDVDCDCNECPF